MPKSGSVLLSFFCLLSLGLFTEAALAYNVSGDTAGLRNKPVWPIVERTTQILNSNAVITDGLRSASAAKRTAGACRGSSCVHAQGKAADMYWTRLGGDSNGMRRSCQGLWDQPFGVLCYCARRRHIHVDTTGAKRVMNGNCGVALPRVQRVAKAEAEEIVNDGGAAYSARLDANYEGSQYQQVAMATVRQRRNIFQAFFDWLGGGRSSDRTPAGNSDRHNRPAYDSEWRPYGAERHDR